MPRVSQDAYLKTYRRFYTALSKESVGAEDTVRRLSSIMAAYTCGQSLLSPPIGARVLLVGSPSSGKSFFASLAAKHLGVPVAKISGATLTPEGFRGSNITDGLQNIYKSGRRRKKQAVSDGGVLIIDEVDKLIKRDQMQEGFCENVLYSLLPILGGESFTTSTEGSGRPLIINTRPFLIFLMGVFPETPTHNWTHYETATKELMGYGYSTEFTARITHIVNLSPPKIEDVAKMIERQAKELAPSYGFKDYKLILNDWVIRSIARKVMISPLGIRSGRLILDEVFHRHLQAREHSGPVVRVSKITDLMGKEKYVYSKKI